jgi:hypothetical protein
VSEERPTREQKGSEQGAEREAPHELPGEEERPLHLAKVEDLDDVRVVQPSHERVLVAEHGRVALCLHGRRTHLLDAHLLLEARALQGRKVHTCAIPPEPRRRFRT